MKNTSNKELYAIYFQNHGNQIAKNNGRESKNTLDEKHSRDLEILPDRNLFCPELSVFIQFQKVLRARRRRYKEHKQKRVFFDWC